MKSHAMVPVRLFVPAVKVKVLLPVVGKSPRFSGPVMNVPLERL